MSLGRTYVAVFYKNLYEGQLTPAGIALTGMNGFIHLFVQSIIITYPLCVHQSEEARVREI
jgi:hypothetical protein